MGPDGSKETSRFKLRDAVAEMANTGQYKFLNNTLADPSIF